MSLPLDGSTSPSIWRFWRALDLDSAPLVSDRWVCVLRRDYPKARRKLSLQTFVALSHVVTSSWRAAGPSSTKPRPAMKRADHAADPPASVPALLSISVMSTDLALVAPLSLAKRYDVAIRELPFETPPLTSCCSGGATRARSLHIRRLRDEAVAAAG